jgi:hypothetical protein
MAKLKEILKAESPVTMSGSVLDLSNWIGGILWVVMFGMIVAIGTKVLNRVDSVVPGNQTPGMSPYIQPSVGSGLNIL